MIGLLAASVALLATWRFLYERVTLMRLYQILFPLTATAFLLLPLLEGTFRQVVYSLVFLVFSVTSSLMVVSCARTARNQSLTPVLVYGTFASIVYASSLAGSVVGLFVGAGRGVGLAELSVVALVAVYALSVAMVAPHGRKAGSVKAASGEKLAPVVGAVGDSVTAGCAVAVERYVCRVARPRFSTSLPVAAMCRMWPKSWSYRRTPCGPTRRAFSQKQGFIRARSLSTWWSPSKREHVPAERELCIAKGPARPISHMSRSAEECFT